MKSVLGSTAEEATLATVEDKVEVVGRIGLQMGYDNVIVGSCDSRRHMTVMKRADYYFAAEFQNDETRRSVWYGRILEVLKYGFLLNGSPLSKVLLLADWMHRLQNNNRVQVYRSCGRKDAFSRASVEDPHIFLSFAGVFDRKVSNVPGRRCYVADPISNAREGLTGWH